LSVQDEDEQLAQSIELEYDSSYELLSSRSERFASMDLTCSQKPRGVLMAAL